MKLIPLCITSILLGNLIQNALSAQIKKSPEEEAAQLGKNIKPISDEEWQATAGSKVTETYSVAPGDTLFLISKRLFGDGRYWPKIWAINNDTISNPHHLRVGTQIAFSLGTGSSLPSVAIDSKENAQNQTATDAGNHSPLYSSMKRSNEWQSLPKQTWEQVNVTLPRQIDPLGFDTRNKVQRPVSTGFHAVAIPATEKIPFLGQIFGSRSESQTLSLNDIVYIRSEENLQVGVTYAITREPYVLKSRKSDRRGFSYSILGKVKLLGVRDNLFIGQITGASDGVARGNSLIPLPDKIPLLNPIPGPRPITGVIIIDHNFSTFTTAQHKEVFIDRGKDDGVAPGMVFRAYEHYDPGTEKRITKSDIIIDADIMITRVTDYFSSGILINSKSTIVENSKVSLLTDISDLLKNDGFRGRNDDELDELDTLDKQDALGKDEKKILRQLENWKGNKDGPDKTIPEGTTPLPPPGPTAPSTTPSPAESDGSSPPTTDVPPPPPAAGPTDPSNASATPPPQESVPPPPPADNLPPPPPPGDLPAPAPSDSAETLLPPPPPADSSEPPPPPPEK